MVFFADFHLHSKYSRATSKDMDLENMSKWAKIKGIKIIGTGDFTHPEWFKNLEEKLEPAEEGLYKLKGPKQEIRFILSAEISCIYSKNGKVRKVHIVVIAPNFETADKINTQLSKIGNLKADGRPILGLDVKKLAEIVLDASKDCLIVPAHAWTPWFGLLGSKSGFDSLEECFEEYADQIYSLETGLSSDPAMNWRLSALDRITLISNSDAHSPTKIGREANAFEGEKIDYQSIIGAIKRKPGHLELIYTIEFYPEEGKYHYDGHKNCDISLSPTESRRYNNVCPVCGRPLTVGVLNRVEELADREKGVKPDNAIPFKSLVPLVEIIAESLGVGVGAKKVETEYQRLIKIFGSEFEVLLNIGAEELELSASTEISTGIMMVREGRVNIEPGYDGVFGKVKIFSEAERKKPVLQKTLF
ncbi:MAG: endonuclease Q family protein [bacterium]